MFERFTDRARQTVVLAQEEARALRHNYIGTEHLLLGLLREPDGIGAQALRRLGLALNDVRSDIIATIGEGSEPASGHIPFTPRAKKVLELSLREALQLGHNYIGTEHILLGLVREGEGVAAQVLIGRGAGLDRVRYTVNVELRRAEAGFAPRAQPRRTPGAEQAIANAQQLAGGTPMGSHHLLEALVRSVDTRAAKVLAALGIDDETLAAKIDEIGPEGTTDITPEESAARQMELRVEADVAHVVLRDEATVDLIRTIVQSVAAPATESQGGQVGGNDPAIGSMAGLWQAIVGSLEELRSRVAPVPEEVETGTSRPSIVRQAIQSRLARRRPR